jgi:uncharacterized membrane protein YebE (DUF533 family)
MFDARSILDALVRGGAQTQGQQQQGNPGALRDLLGQLTRGGQRAQPGDAPAASPRGRTPRDSDGPDDLPSPGQQGGGGGGLEDLLRRVQSGQGGGLGDVLAKLQQQGGGLADMLGKVLGQATSGVRESAGRIDDATGASRHAREAVGQATGRTPEEMIAQIKELIANNKLGTGAALGGLGALILGTNTGRSLAGTAAKLGSVALIGGLAYSAYRNYQQGRPAIAGANPQQQSLLAPPEGSGFEPGAISNESATLLIRAMIAAAAADGRIDAKEQQAILSGMKQARLDAAAQQFLAREIGNPATVDDLAGAVSSPEEAVQVYTAARIAVDPDLEEEHAFLAALADRLGIDESLAAHIDATARNAGA